MALNLRISTCGSRPTLWAEIVITGWTALQLTDSPLLVTITSVCRAASGPLIGPFAGAIADRVDRVCLARIAEVDNLLTLALLGSAFLTGHGSYQFLLLGTLWFGISVSLASLARAALLVDVVDSEHLLPAIVLDRLTGGLAQVFGPLLAGILLRLFGSGVAYAVLMLFPILSLIALRNLAVKQAVDESVSVPIWEQLREGLAYVRRESVILTVLLLHLAMSCFVYPARHPFPMFAQNVLRAGPVALALMGSANGFGAHLMLMLLPRLKGASTHGLTLLLGAALGSLALAAFATSTTVPLALLLLVISGLGQAGFDVMASTLILSQSKPVLRGRVIGLFVLTAGGLPVGALCGGVVADRWGTPLTIGVSGVLCACVVVIIYRQSSQLSQFSSRKIQESK